MTDELLWSVAEGTSLEFGLSDEPVSERGSVLEPFPELAHSALPLESRSLAAAATPAKLRARLRSLGRLPNHVVLSELLQLNRQQHRLEAELLLFLGELDQRQLYREHAVASAFEFCVSRLGYAEDVAWKRVGAARLIRRFPRIYELLVAGHIHLTAVMLLRPHLTEENHEEWLSLACNKSKRQIEKLVASRCPRPDVPPSIRKLPASKPALATTRSTSAEMRPEMSGALSSDLATVGGDASKPAAVVTADDKLARGTSAIAVDGEPVAMGAALPVGAGQVARVSSDHSTSGGPLRIAPSRTEPLSSSTYRVTFTATAQLKQKLDRAAEMLSHTIKPCDLAGLLERALDCLLEREEKRRYGARPSERHGSPRNSGRQGEPEGTRRNCRNSQRHDPKGATGGSAHEDEREEQHWHDKHRRVAPPTQGEPEHVSCQKSPPPQHSTQYPDPARMGCARSHGDDRARNHGDDRARNHDDDRAPKTKRRRHVPVAIRRAVFDRDGGQCTFVDAHGRRCVQRRYLELDHVEAYALGGGETVSNLRLRCACHNQLEAESLFGRQQVKSAIKRGQ